MKDAFKRVRAISREDALKKVIKKTTTCEVFSTKFHPSLPSISKILKRLHTVMIEEDEEMKQIFLSPSRQVQVPGKALDQ